MLGFRQFPFILSNQDFYHSQLLLDALHYVDSYCCQLKSILSSMITQRRLHRQHEIHLQNPSSQFLSSRQRKTSSVCYRSQSLNRHPLPSSASSCVLSSHIDDQAIRDRHEASKRHGWINRAQPYPNQNSPSIAETIQLSKESIVSACIFAVSSKSIKWTIVVSIILPFLFFSFQSIIGIGCSLPQEQRSHFDKCTKSLLFDNFAPAELSEFLNDDSNQIESDLFPSSKPLIIGSILPGFVQPKSVSTESKEKSPDENIDNAERIVTSAGDNELECDDQTKNNDDNLIMFTELKSSSSFEWMFDWWKDEWMTWKNWASRVQKNVLLSINFPFIEGAKHRKPLSILPIQLELMDSPVLTTDFIRHSFIIHHSVIHRTPLLIVGSTATGKTLTLEHVSRKKK